MANCRPFLDEQTDIIRPRVIMALGAPAAKSFLGRDFQITKMRGRWYEGPAGIPLMVTFHPAYVLRQTGGELTAVKRMVWADLKAVRTKIDEVLEPPAQTPEQASLF
jgi:DNA polymerase